MKFTVEKNTLLKSLSHVQSIVEKKNTLPILSNILLDAKENSLILSATDMDISITEKLNCNIIEEGSTTVSAQKSVQDHFEEAADKVQKTSRTLGSSHCGHLRQPWIHKLLENGHLLLQSQQLAF